MIPVTAGLQEMAELGSQTEMVEIKTISQTTSESEPACIRGRYSRDLQPPDIRHLPLRLPGWPRNLHSSTVNRSVKSLLFHKWSSYWRNWDFPKWDWTSRSVGPENLDEKVSNQQGKRVNLRSVKSWLTILYLRSSGTNLHSMAELSTHVQ